MITNFEEITADLTADETKLLPILIKGFLLHSKDNPIKAPEIIRAINSQAEKYGLKKGLTEPRLRKLCGLIRCKSIIPLIATSSGYFVSHDPDVIRSQITSLEERADSIRAAAIGLESFLL